MAAVAPLRPTEQWDYITHHLLALPARPEPEVPIWVHEEQGTGVAVALVPQMSRPAAGVVPLGRFKPHSKDDAWLLCSTAEAIVRGR